MKETLQGKVDNTILKRLEVLERRIILNNTILKRLEVLERILNGKIPLENLTLVERIKELEISFANLATALKELQSELVNLKTLIGFNE